MHVQHVLQFRIRGSPQYSQSVQKNVRVLLIPCKCTGPSESPCHSILNFTSQTKEAAQDILPRGSESKKESQMQSIDLQTPPCSLHDHAAATKPLPQIKRYSFCSDVDSWHWYAGWFARFSRQWNAALGQKSNAKRCKFMSRSSCLASSLPIDEFNVCTNYQSHLLKLHNRN